MKTLKSHIIYLAITILFLSCNNKKDSVSNENSANQKNANEDIELLKEYLQKENKTLTDKDGFALNYKIDRSVGKIVKLATSDTVTNTGTYQNSQFLILSVQECIFSLYLNGKHIKDIHLIAQVFNLNELNPSLSNRIPTKYFEDINYYFPEFEDESLRKTIIKKITSSSFAQSGFKQTENDIMLTNKWTNLSTELIKSTNILEYKSVLDIKEIKLL